MRPILYALLLTGLAWPVQAATELIMVEQDGCPWCARWDAEVAPEYPKTEVGRLAPLRRIDLHDAVPEDLSLRSRPRITPTFILVDDGQELGRIEGYPGEDFFWGMLDNLVEEAGVEPADRSR